MAFTLTPTYGQAGTYTAQADRLLLAAQANSYGAVKIGAPSSGTLTGDCAIVTSGSANNQVNLLSGGLFLRWSSSSNQGFYYAYNDATINNALTSALPAGTASDQYCLIYAKIADTGAAAPNVTIAYEGPAASPPTSITTADATPLAYVKIPAGTGATYTVAAANIFDLRPKAGIPDLSVSGTSSLVLPSPSVGQVAYTVNQSNPQNSNANNMVVYNGSKWQGANGMHLITTGSTITSNTITLDSIFTSTFANYRIVVTNFVSSVNGSFTVGFRTGGTTNTTANYWSAGVSTTTTAISSAFGNVGATSAVISGSIGTTLSGSMTIDLLSPQAAAITGMSGLISALTSTTGYSVTFAGGFNATTSFDGIVISRAATLTSANYYVYGYNQ